MATRQTLDCLTAKERMVLQTKLPEILAHVARVKVEFHRVLVEPLNIRTSHCPQQSLLWAQRVTLNCTHYVWYTLCVVLDQQPTGRSFDPQPFCCHAVTWGKSITLVPSSIHCYWKCFFCDSIWLLKHTDTFFMLHENSVNINWRCAVLDMHTHTFLFPKMHWVPFNGSDTRKLGR